MDVYEVCLKGRVELLSSAETLHLSSLLVAVKDSNTVGRACAIAGHQAPVPQLLHVIVARLDIFSTLINCEC